MVLRCIGITILAILASTTVAATEFHVSGRVDVIPALAVSGSGNGASDTGERVILVQGTQDQCLDVTILDGNGSDLAAAFSGLGDGTRVHVRNSAVAGDSRPPIPTIQIHVN